MSNTVRVFVINLETDTERKQAMTERLDALGIEPIWTTAVDGRGTVGASVMEHVDLARVEKSCGKISAPEVACALSHLNVYRYMVVHNIPAAVVLEDDMVFDADLASLIETEGDLSIISHIPTSSAAVVSLSFCRRVTRFGSKKLGVRSLHRVSGALWLAGAYVLTLEAAKRLATSRYPIWTVADHWEAIAKDAKLSLWCVNPIVARESGVPSSIADKSMQRQTIPRRPLKTRIAHMVYRGLLRPLLTRHFSQNG